MNLIYGIGIAVVVLWLGFIAYNLVKAIGILRSWRDK